MHRLGLCSILAQLLYVLASPVAAQISPGATGTLVIATQADAPLPIPTLFTSDAANRGIADLMFLRLLDLGPALNTRDEKSFIPRLARSWRRVDSLTLVFELDSRARWHDGHPVVAADVVLALDFARNPKVDPQLAMLMQGIASATADGDHRVTVRFKSAYSEQLYDATYHAPPLPAHLLAAVAPESLATSTFAATPVGNGPFRWVRRIPGQLMELAANDQFFLGRPKLRRVVYLVAADPEARINLLLSGQADAIDNIYQFQNPARLEQLPAFRLYPTPTLVYGALVFNQRDPADTSRPHPFLSNVIVRRALMMALDRSKVVQSAFGKNASAPSVPISSALVGAMPALPSPVAFDPNAARRMLATQGWTDHDGDGILDHDGQPLRLALIFPSTSSTRRTMALQLQEQLRLFGVTVDLQPVERQVYTTRRHSGQFDLDFYSGSQDPTPSGLTQSWSCTGNTGASLAHFCDPRFDSLLAGAIAAPPANRRVWQQAFEVLAADTPALMYFAPTWVFAVHQRFAGVRFRPESSYSAIWQWAVRPGEQVERDRQ